MSFVREGERDMERERGGKEREREERERERETREVVISRCFFPGEERVSLSSFWV